MINWFKNLEVFEEVAIIFNFMISIIFIGVFFSTIMIVAFYVNELIYYYNDIRPFPGDIFYLFKLIKQFILYGDFLIISIYVGIVTSLGVKKLYSFGKKELSKKEK